MGEYINTIQSDNVILEIKVPRTSPIVTTAQLFDACRKSIDAAERDNALLSKISPTCLILNRVPQESEEDSIRRIVREIDRLTEKNADLREDNDRLDRIDKRVEALMIAAREAGWDMAGWIQDDDEERRNKCQP